MKRDNSVFTLWLLGPTSSGKTTLANLLLERINTETNLGAIHFDGDEIRDMFGSDFGFTEENRQGPPECTNACARQCACAVFA